MNGHAYAYSANPIQVKKMNKGLGSQLNGRIELRFSTMVDKTCVQLNGRRGLGTQLNSRIGLVVQLNGRMGLGAQLND